MVKYANHPLRNDCYHHCACCASVGLGMTDVVARVPLCFTDMTTFSAVAAASMLAGTMLLMWIGEQIITNEVLVMVSA